MVLKPSSAVEYSLEWLGAASRSALTWATSQQAGHTAVSAAPPCVGSKCTSQCTSER